MELYVKRDDLTGLLESGGEVRKLEFLAAEALSQGADTLITCGRPQSNACRAVAAVAARLGCRAVIAVEGERPDGYDGNLLLGRMLGAEVRYLVDPEGRRAPGVLDDIAAEVRARGGRPYLIPEGGANEVGALGYLEGGVELAEQINHGAPRFDTVAVAAESGASQAGLLMGKHLAGLPAEIVGVPVTDRADVVRGRIAGIIGTAIRRFGFAIDVPKAIHLLDGYQGRDGGVAEEDLRAVVDLARDEGILFDPVVTIKAFRGLLDTLGRDAKALGQRVCFINTGGLFSLFPLRDGLSGLLDHI
jgi:1-aminocyclopropane-1-carboxylate deaminase/D-cysteine desulfhydrase-like pyridoxal-dependent ACC family enzyme